MDDATLRQAVFETLGRIAPEVSPADIEPAAPLRDQVDLDSADWLNFLVALHGRLGIDIPDADAARLTTLDKLVEYCEKKL
jgi:acyl carrier protein